MMADQTTPSRSSSCGSTTDDFPPQFRPRSKPLNIRPNIRRNSPVSPHKLLSPNDNRQSTSLTYGGLDHTFVDPVPPDLQCPICTKVLREPHLTDCCGHHYCSSCLHHWIETGVSSNCPHCRAPNYNHIRDLKVERRIRELKIKCTNAELGCEWEGPILDIEAHLDGPTSSVKRCDYVLCECENRCGQFFIRKQLLAHMNAVCPLRTVQCEHCKLTFTYEAIVTDHYSNCPEMPVECSNKCGCVLKRSELGRHSNEECPNEFLECPFLEVGCGCRVPRKDLESHVRTCKDKNLVKAFMKLKTDFLAQGEELQVAKEENQLLWKELVHLQRGVASSHNNLEILRRRTSTIHSVLHNEMYFLHSTTQPWEKLSLECIKTQISGNVVHLTPGGKYATFRMPDFSDHKQTGQVWYTPAFFIGRGYKLCFAFHPNGVGTGRGSHMSVYLHQVPGEYDEQLKWPYLLEEDFEVRLMRQNDTSDRSRRRSRVNLSSISPLNNRRLPRSRDSSPAPNSGLRAHLPSVSLLQTPVVCQEPQSEERDDSLLEGAQVMCVSEYLIEPERSSKTVGGVVSKLDLFCTQSMMEGVVYGDSLVFQCGLGMKQDTVIVPDTIVESGWENWNRPR